MSALCTWVASEAVTRAFSAWWVKRGQGFFRQTLKGESVDDAGPVSVVLAILLAQEILKQRRNAGKRERIKAQIP
jgi:hypothetical protein